MPITEAKTRQLLSAMRSEMRRNLRSLKSPGNPDPYFLSYLLHAREGLSVWGRYGSVFASESLNEADIYGELRVGSRRFDQVIDGGLMSDLDDRVSYDWTDAPNDLNENGIKYALWKLTQHKYEEALHDYFDKKKILVEQHLPMKDAGFSKEQRLNYYEAISPVRFPKKRWEEYIRDVSGLFADYRWVADPYVEVRGVNLIRVFCNSEGSSFITQDRYYEINVRGWHLAKDGVHVEASRRFTGRRPKDMPNRDQVAEAIDSMARELQELSRAKPLAPYAGPALLSGMASGLFFHEAIGHRLEGERMIARGEGQTFATKVGQRILPEGVDIIDDPTVSHYNGVPLHGHYSVDDEGVPAQKVVLVEDGVLKNFLMSRSIIKGARHSNGHGRHERYQDPMARMANLIVTSRKARSWDALKDRLMRETRKRNLPYGIIVRDVVEGETRTDEYDFQAFKGVPTSVWTVDPKSGRETRVRDVAFIGTPLGAIQRILAFGEDEEVDNSYCFAESGAVPVSTIAPSMLVRSLELQKASTRRFRKPRVPLPRF